MIIKPFLEQGNYITMHKILFDDVMPHVSTAAWSVLSFVIRKTIGWQKDVDTIAQSQIVAGTGILSEKTVRKGINELVIVGILHVFPGERMPNGRMESSSYALNKDFEIAKEPGVKITAGGNFYRDNNIPNNKKSISSTRYLGRTGGDYMKPATGEDLEAAYDEDFLKMQGNAAEFAEVANGK